MEKMVLYVNMFGSFMLNRILCNISSTGVIKQNKNTTNIHTKIQQLLLNLK